MSDVMVMQPNSTVYYLSESMCSLDVNNTIRYTNKTPTAPIIGKKIISEQKLLQSDDEKPAPFQIFVKKKRNDKSPTHTNKKNKRNKLKSCSNRKLPQEIKNDCKKTHMKKNKQLNVSKPPVNRSFKRVKTSQKENLKEKENDRSVSFKAPSPSIESIIKTTLKRAMINKIRQEKEKKGLEEMKEIRKQEIQQHNMQIREENARFKKIKFIPKYSWGVDQNRLKDPQRPRKSMEKAQYKRPKSSERVRTGLDTIKEIQMELGLMHFRSRSLSHKSESVDTSYKKNWHPNPEVKAFMKKQDQCRKQKIIYENLHKFAEESRRRAQLQKLEDIRKPTFFFKKKPKKIAKKKLAKKTKKNRDNNRDKEVIKEESQEDQKSLSFVFDSKSNENEDEKSMHMDLRVPDLSRITKKSDKDKSESYEDYSEKMMDSSVLEDNTEDEDLRHYAATKIQAHVRRFLVERRLQRQESFESADDLVMKIINKGSKSSKKPNTNSSSDKKYAKGLMINIPSSDTSRSESLWIDPDEMDSPILKDTLSKSPKSFSIESRSENLKESTDKSIEESMRELSQIQEIQEKKTEYQEKLKEQLIWREAQMISLESLRKKEIRDMQIIAEKVGKSEELGELLSSVVEKRYSQLSALFEENFKDVQDILIQDLNTEEREQLEETLEEKREEFSKLIENDSKTMEEYIEEIVSINQAEESDTSSENRPVIYNPKNDLMLSYEEVGILPTDSKVHKIVSSNNKESLIQESTINQDYSDEFDEDSYQKIVGDIPSSPSPDFSVLDQMQQINILSSSPEKSSRRKVIKPESPPESQRVLEEFKQDKSFDSVQEISLLGQMPSDFAGSPFYSQEHIPERPSAPLQFEPGRESPYINTSPGIQSSSDNELVSDPINAIEWLHMPDSIDITPELVVQIAEDILIKLIEDHQSLHFEEHSDLHLNIHIGPAPEGSSSEEPQIQTDSVAVKNYLDEIFSQVDLDHIQALLKIPLKREPLEILNKMQEVELGSIIEADFDVYPDLLNVNLYLSLESNRENATQTSNSPHTNQYIIEAEHIHNKMIFDATNEALQKYRPYRLNGQPMPWSISTRSIGHIRPIQEIIDEVKDEIVDWSSIQAGKICTEDMLMSNGLLDEELLQQVREERLASMLAEEIIEKDEMWTNYEFEETQVKLDLADMILEVLATETITILNG